MSKKVELRNLDGVYFRIKRNDEYKNICFSDLTNDEMDEVLKDRKGTWLRELCKILGNSLREIGDHFDITCN
jgi:hypothetical protein